MSKEDIGIYLNLGIAAIVEIIIIFVYPIITRNALILHTVDYVLLLISIIFIAMAVLSFKDLYGRVMSYISIGLCIFMLITWNAVIPGFIALIGSIIMYKRT